MAEKIKVMSIFGTRPEATKMAPLIKVMEENENIDPIICVTTAQTDVRPSS